MNKYKITFTGWDEEKTVEADAFMTQGEFVDFYKDGLGWQDVCLRIRAEHVSAIERQ